MCTPLWGQHFSEKMLQITENLAVLKGVFIARAITKRALDINITGPLRGESLVTDGFPSQNDNSKGSVFMPWRNNAAYHTVLYMKMSYCEFFWSRSGEIGYYDFVALKFDMHLGSAAAEVPGHFFAR